MIAAVLLLFAAPVQAEDNAGVNAVYDRMSVAYAQHDRSLLSTIFHPRMVTSSAEPDRPPVIGGAALAETVGAGFDRLKQGNRQAELNFRITHRGWAGNTVVDSGVLRMRFRGGHREERTVYSRFLSTLIKQKGGNWMFLADSPRVATQADWDKAAPFPGARFDR
jgi:hypothetical protein